MLKALSTAGAVALVLTAACVDPKGSLKEFESRVVDAAPKNTKCPTFENGVPNISGTWLFGARDTVVPQSADIIFLFTFKMNLGQKTVDSTAQPLDFTTKKPVGNPISSTGIPVEECLFDIPFDATVPATANPITQAEAVLDADVPAYIQSDKFICGSLHGTVPALNFNLENQTFGMIPVDADAVTKGTLPPSIHRCEDKPAS
jgi:hypothetical protein